MKILIDECLPVKLKKSFLAYEVWTVADKSWNGKKNGELLTLASAEFDVFLTIDQNISYQQNITQYNIAIIGVKAKSNSLNDLEPLVPLIEEALSACKAGNIYRIGL